MNNFYVYAWYYKTNNHIFYIGKGVNNRYKELKQSRNEYFKNIINKHFQEIDVKLLYENLSEEKAWQQEKEAIAYYKKLGQCEANFHEGGLGGNTHNYKVVGEKVKQYRAKHPLTVGQKEIVEKMHDAVRGVPKTEEWKRQCRQWLNTFYYEVYYQNYLIYHCLGRRHLYDFMKKYFKLGHGIVDNLLKDKNYKPHYEKHQWITEKQLKITSTPIKSVSTTGDEFNQVEWVFPPLEVQGIQKLDEEIVSLQGNLTK